MLNSDDRGFLLNVIGAASAAKGNKALSASAAVAATLIAGEIDAISTMAGGNAGGGAAKTGRVARSPRPGRAKAAETPSA